MVTTARQIEEATTAEAKAPQPLLDDANEPRAPGDPLLLRLPSSWRLTDNALFEIFELNESLTFERTVEGDLVIVPAPSGPSPMIGAAISAQVWNWVMQGGGGEVRDASGGYKLGETPPPEEEEKQAARIPDVSWLPQDVLESISEEDYEDGELVLCPPFVVEIISAKQRVSPQKEKMQEWISYGVQLGWLIDRKREKVWIYRAGQDEPEELDQPATLSGEDVLEGFELDCAPIWR